MNEMNTININCKQLEMLYHTAIVRGTLEAFGALAVEWAQKADVEIESLRDEVEALRAALQRLADRRYDLCPTQIVHIVNEALHGEGEK